MVGFFQENEGENSITRLVFGVGAAWAAAMSSYLLIMGTSPTEVLAFFSGILATLGGLKVIQRFSE